MPFLVLTKTVHFPLGFTKSPLSNLTLGRILLSNDEKWVKYLHIRLVQPLSISHFIESVVFSYCVARKSCSSEKFLQSILLVYGTDENVAWF